MSKELRNKILNYPEDICKFVLDNNISQSDISGYSIDINKKQVIYYWSEIKYK